MVGDKLQLLLGELVSTWDAKAELKHIQPLTPDASLRRYYRIWLEPTSAPVESLIAMVFDSVKPAEVGQGVSVDSDQAYVELTSFFLANNIPVPKLYLDAREKSVLLIEDLGQTLLCHAIIGSQAQAYTAEEVDELYRAAVDLIISIQAIPTDDSLFAFKRSFTPELYLLEMNELIDYTLKPLDPSARQLGVIKDFMGILAEELTSFPSALTHRDFHSWNLLIDSDNKIRVIDFQDALLAPVAYDVVGLLNDRDTDVALGPVRYQMLLEYFHERSGMDGDFYEKYHRMLLQRDLKVAGRFSKLVAERGLTSYQEWINGTVRRIGTSLNFLSTNGQNTAPYKQFRSTLGQLLPVAPGTVG